MPQKWLLRCLISPLWLFDLTLDVWSLQQGTFPPWLSNRTAISNWWLSTKSTYVHLSTIVQRGEIWTKYEQSSNESVVLNSEPFQAFKLFDKDGDGLVTLSELMSLIKKARMKVKTLECSIKGPPALEKLLSDRPASGGREHAWAGGKSSARGGGPGGFFTTNSNWPSAGWLFLKTKLGCDKKYCVGNSQDGNQGVDYQEFTRLWSMIRAPIEVFREKQLKYKERSQCC